MGEDSTSNASGVISCIERCSEPTNVEALYRRAQAVVKDKSIDPDSHAIISYALQIDDPWLPELVRRVAAGENIAESFDYSRAAAVVEDMEGELLAGERLIS